MPRRPSPSRELAIWKIHEDWPNPPMLRSLGVSFNPRKRLPLPGTELHARVLHYHRMQEPLPDGMYLARYCELPEQTPVRFVVDRGELLFRTRPGYLRHGAGLPVTGRTSSVEHLPRALPSARELEREKVLKAMRAVEANSYAKVTYPLSAELRAELLQAGYTLSSEDQASFTLIWWNK